MRRSTSPNSRPTCFLAVMMSVIALGGCASVSARAERESVLKQAPKWYLSLPDEKGAFLATGTAESPLMGAAVDIATSSARGALSQRISAEVEGKINDQLKQNQQATSAGALQDVKQQYLSGFEIRTRQELNGSRIKERKVVASTNGYVAWVLVELPKESINEAAAAQALDQMNRSVDEQAKAFWKEFERKMRQP